MQPHNLMLIGNVSEDSNLHLQKYNMNIEHICTSQSVLWELEINKDFHKVSNSQSTVRSIDL